MSSWPLRLAVVLATLGALSPAVADAADSWSDPFPGVRRLHRVTANQNLNVLVIDLCAPGISLRATTSDERQRTVPSFGALVGAQAAVNGDFFSYTDYGTNGPSMGGGVGWGGVDHGYVAPAQFGRHQVALPPHDGTGGVASWAREVVSGHPTLLADGARRDNNGDALCTARHPRTALGLSADRGRLFLAVIDGRATGRAGMTCDEMIALFEELGAAHAVNLDGGGSSTMWLTGAGTVNYPSDGAPRVVANHLAIRATGSGEATSCPTPRYDASDPRSEAPMVMTSGDEAAVWMEATNRGNATWDLDQTRVGTQEPQDRASAFFKEGNWLSPSRASGADHSDYAPGSAGRFTWVMVAPEVTESTMFEETFQLVQEGVAWFGPTVTMSILVHPRSGPTPPDAEPEPGPEPDSGDGDGGGGGCAVGGDGGRASGLALLVIVLMALQRRGGRARCRASAHR